MTKRMKALIITVSVLLVIVLSGLGVAGNFFYNLALNPDSDKAFLEDNPDLGEVLPTTAVLGASLRLDREAGERWFIETPREEWTLTSNDGLKLQGYQYESEQPTNKWVVVVHGYMNEAKNMGSDVKMFVDKGFHVLAVDLRGHGLSEGDYIGMGWHDRIDMVDWINLIISKQSDAQIVLYGVSMGGATVMMTSGEELPTNVKAIIEDCGYTSAKDEFTYQLKRLFNLPSFPVMNAAGFVTQIRAGYSLEEASALKQVAKSNTPMLFIHGDQDTFVPSEMVYELYEAAPVEKELLIIEGAGHGKASKAGEVYWGKVWEFMNKYLT